MADLPDNSKGDDQSAEEFNKSTGKRVAKSAGIVGIAVACSRILGLVREQAFATLFGAGMAYDAFVVAFRIPNLLRDLLAEGALATAFVTVFSQYDSKHGKEETWELASVVFTFFACFLSVLTLIGIIFAEPLVSLLAPKFSSIEGKIELTVLLTRIMFPFLIFVSLAAIAMGMLNSKGKFFIPSLSSAFFNLGSIVGGVSLALIFPHFNWPAIAGMACGTLIGGALQFLIQLPALYKTGFSFRANFNFTHPGLKKILLLMAPATVGLSATQFNIFINTNFASGCMEGSVSWLNYAFRMVQLPIGMFGVALSMAALPILARQAVNKDMNGLKNTFSSSLVMVFALTIPASVGLIILAEPIIKLIFEHGAFTSFDTKQTAAALSCYAIGLFAYSAVKITVPVFYALDKTRYPVIASFIAVAANIIIIKLTIEYFQFQAIALSTSLVMMLNFFFLALILHKELNGYKVGGIMVGIGKIIIACSVMALTLIYGKQLLATWINQELYKHIAAISLLIGSGITAYGLSLYVLKLPEFITLIETDRFTKRQD